MEKVINYSKKYMDEALKEALLCKTDIPVGCIVVDKNGTIIGRGHNDREETRNIAGHAEINAINSAFSATASTHLEDCELYVTLEPCSMCSGAILESGIKTVYYGADSDKGACGSSLNLFHPYIKVYGGFEQERCRSLIKAFFRKLRS